ncbi:hypothetical protein ABH942_003144, partial [Flavobacterium sp. 28YEA47A]
ADGTAILWESMSPPSFEKGSHREPFFVLEIIHK